jgi:hypothetical protein
MNEHFGRISATGISREINVVGVIKKANGETISGIRNMKSVTPFTHVRKILLQSANDRLGSTAETVGTAGYFSHGSQSALEPTGGHGA